MNSMRKTIVVACLLICGLLIGQPTKANTIVYEGHLTNPSGQPLNGDFEITFRLYSGPSTTDVLWQEQHSILVADGYFSAPLGSVRALSAGLFSDDVYLGIEVGNTGELKPRTRLGAAPVAFFPMGLSDRVRIIPASGTPEENGTRLLNAIAELQPSQGERGATIILDSGLYDLGENFLDVTNLTLVGQGRKSTVIRSSTHVFLFSGTVAPGLDGPSDKPSTIMHMRIEHFPNAVPGQFASTANIGFTVGQTHIEHVDIKMASEAPGVRCYGLNFRSAGIINNVSVDISCIDTALGIVAQRLLSDVIHISDVHVRVNAGSMAGGLWLGGSADSVLRNASVVSTSADAHFPVDVARGFAKISDVSVKIDATEDDTWYQAVRITSDVVDISDISVNASMGGASYPYIFDNTLYNYGVRINANSGHVRGVRVRMNGTCNLAEGGPSDTVATFGGLAFSGGSSDDVLVVRDASIEVDLDGDCSAGGVGLHTTSRIDFYDIDAHVSCNGTLRCEGFRTVSMEANRESSGIVNRSSFRVHNAGSGPAEAARLSTYSMDAFGSQFISNKDSIVSFSVEGTSVMPSTIRNGHIFGNLQASNPLSISLSELELDPSSSNLSNTTCKGVVINGFFSANSC